MNDEPFEPETPPNDAYKIDTNTPEGAPEADEAAREPFPAEVFPGVGGELIQETRRVQGCDPDIPGGCVLAAISTVLGRGLQIDRRGQRTGGNVFSIIAAGSGIGKSESSRPIFAPLHAIETELAKACEEHKADRTARLRSAEAAAKAMEKPKPDETPQDRADREAKLKEELEKIEVIKAAMIPPRLLAENVTTEQLARMLQANGEQLGVFSPDCGDVVSNLLGRYTDGKEDESLLLKAYSGDPVRVDRVGRDPVTLVVPCLTMCLLGTPPVLRKLWANEQFRTGGLLPRLLPVFSRSLPAFDDGSNRAINPDVAARWDRLIRKLHTTFHEAREPFTVVCSPEADEVFRAARNEFVRLCRDGTMPEVFQSFATREAEQAIRIAINLHAMKYGAKATEPLDENTAKAGVKLAAWFLAEHRRALADTLADKARSEADKLATKLEAAGGSATMRELKRWHFKEVEIKRIVETFPERFTTETVRPERGGQTSVKIKFAKGCR